ncbi:uncharacterized protein PSFLO_01550 [Pseudozyma flocculosa]|uniref:Uncharacterized protein n=1 Tax=Pseudozyma flocculosa TaxID=84751 RepID=A0A5C3EY80_9BASI|nr:uncharacterized protein PSFLO_01550 [Pseudozyma flocculosa]
MSLPLPSGDRAVSCGDDLRGGDDEVEVVVMKEEAALTSSRGEREGGEVGGEREKGPEGVLVLLSPPSSRVPRWKPAHGLAGIASSWQATWQPAGLGLAWAWREEKAGQPHAGQAGWHAAKTNTARPPARLARSPSSLSARCPACKEANTDNDDDDDDGSQRTATTAYHEKGEGYIGYVHLQGNPWTNEPEPTQRGGGQDSTRRAATDDGRQRGQGQATPAAIATNSGSEERHTPTSARRTEEGEEEMGERRRGGRRGARQGSYRL